MIRRWPAAVILTLFGMAVAGAAFTGWWYARESPPHQGPIVLISVAGFAPDQLSSEASTPADASAIDALAAEGVVFDRAYVHSLQLLPAEASMLSGRLPFDHGVRGNAGFALNDSVRTVAELLRNRGFNTGGAVSSFLLRRDSGVAQGFSFYDAELPDVPTDDGPAVERDGILTWDAAERWVRMQGDQRFFLYVQVSRPSAEPVVARLVQQLREAGFYESATILLVGEVAPDGPATSLTDGALRVPLIIKQPDGAGAGRRVSAPVQHVDLLPTILDLVRAPMPSGLRGRSLRPMLDDNAVIADQPIYSEALQAHFVFGGAAVFALTTGDYQYIRGRDERLVNLRDPGPGTRDPKLPEPADPGSRIPDSGSRLRDALDRLLAGQAIDVPADIAAADEDRYAALGYLPGMRVAVQQPAPTQVADEAALLAGIRNAARLTAQKKFSSAIEVLRSMTRKYPMVAILQYQLGSLLVRTGRSDEAAAAFRAAGTLNPDSPDILVALADALMRTRQYDDAREQADLAVAVAEKSDASARAAAHEVAARIALTRNDAESAIDHAEDAQKADPALPLPQFVRGRLMYAEGRYEDALVAFQEAETALKESGRSLAELHYYLADTLARLDRYAEAEMEFREELRQFPRNIRPYSSLAMLYRASNRDRAVEQIIRDLMETAPTPEGYAMAASLWTILGERSRAEAVRLDARTRFRGDTRN
jgi:tetratricopeptide (TPR) repeat protein